ncbi:hypothetical protein EYF80_022163 [Liparis tanakae]|uniref:Uncharacterized protein n=1 Tax=Liparis tanakae TaxID=230148 RepID=A0A4Z2HRG4_9TELE|nr:hypothetical protein EYF80_022163 [Liparis tanakae]
MAFVLKHHVDTRGTMWMQGEIKGRIFKVLEKKNSAIESKSLFAESCYLTWKGLPRNLIPDEYRRRPTQPIKAQITRENYLDR